MSLVRLKKKRKNWNVVIGQASSKCPGLSVSTVSSVLIKIKEERETVWINKGFKRCIRDFVRCELHYMRTCGQDITNSGTRGGNNSAAISMRFACGERQYICVSIPSFKLLQVELVRVFLTSNLGQNLLVVVITQCPTKFLVGHVSSAIPFTPKPCHVVGAYDNELPVSRLPGHDWRHIRVWQNVENELKELGPGFQCILQQI